MTAMSESLKNWLVSEVESGKVSGVIALGGSGGTAIVAPRLAGSCHRITETDRFNDGQRNAQPYVGHSDITMMYSVVDIAGLRIGSHDVYSVTQHTRFPGWSRTRLRSSPDRATVGMTMFGVTTPCVEMVRKALEIRGMDPLVFHATGVGGQAMEKLVSDGLIGGVLDITTTEVADEVVGGVMPGGPYRFDAVIRAKSRTSSPGGPRHG